MRGEGERIRAGRVWFVPWLNPQSRPWERNEGFPLSWKLPRAPGCSGAEGPGDKRGFVCFYSPLPRSGARGP